MKRSRRNLAVSAKLRRPLCPVGRLGPALLKLQGRLAVELAVHEESLEVVEAVAGVLQVVLAADQRAEPRLGRPRPVLVGVIGAAYRTMAERNRL